ncbi:MAG: ribonuclease PH [Myxococcota bacterium]|nr:ribonuclease PH [Myxococcota bacterium]
MRKDGRADDQLRPIKITPDFLTFAHGSCLIEVGETRVLCTAMIEESVPRWMKHSGKGWVTAEYSMLPGSTNRRTSREVARGKPGGRTMEIQRLIGRSLRTITDMTALGQRTIWLDCDVLQADGGTRCASITGAFVAHCLALQKLVGEGELDRLPIRGTVAAISAGVVGGTAVLDLPYEEDSRADVDMNFVVTGDNLLVEVQGTAEKEPFDRSTLDRLTELALGGCAELRQAQLLGLGEVAVSSGLLPR